MYMYDCLWRRARPPRGRTRRANGFGGGTHAQRCCVLLLVVVVVVVVRAFCSLLPLEPRPALRVTGSWDWPKHYQQDYTEGSDTKCYGSSDVLPEDDGIVCVGGSWIVAPTSRCARG